MDDFLRKWREDAASRNQLESAIFIGDKLLAFTENDGDAIRLAELYFSTGNYLRALALLSVSDLPSRKKECQHLAALCHFKQGKIDDALTVLGDATPPQLLLNMGKRRKHPRIDDNFRRPSSKHGKSGHEQTAVTHANRSSESAAHVRVEAAMCYLRGLCYAKQNAFDKAKGCYTDAVKLDVQCFEAFDQLTKNALMSPEEEWAFLEELDFESVSAGNDVSASQQAAELTKMLYISRLSKYTNSGEILTAIETLSTHYKLSTNPDLLLSKAELLFTQCRYKEALAFTSMILEHDRYNFGTLPLHLACLHELCEKNALFLIAHDFADKHPEEPSTWFAVGVYYLSIGKIAESRRFFSKSSMMDPHFGPAWIGFAHTFAAEGEHDQAISAYATAARLFQGTHLPQLFLGMQNLQLQNITLASEYLESAYKLCETDPLVLNELGVVFYHENRFQDAITAFSSALEISKAIDADSRAFVATRANLGHAYRRTRQWQQAIDTFDEALRIAGRDATIFSAKAMVLLDLNRPWDATTALHEALAVNPQDPIANDLLNKALEETAAQVRGFEAIKEQDVEDLLEARKQESRSIARRNPIEANGSFSGK